MLLTNSLVEDHVALFRRFKKMLTGIVVVKPGQQKNPETLSQLR